jgi:hypothetical protein
MQPAAEELLALGPDGLQLTPGNAPTGGFATWLSAAGVRTRTHHGFHPGALRQRVWSDDGACLVPSDSVHPPRGEGPQAAAWRARVEAGEGALPVLETMYPGYALGTGEELEWAMGLGLRLAVDVSHLRIQQEAGVLGERTWRRLQGYARIDEVHVSESHQRRDAHRPLHAGSFGLAWARERLAAGTPVILECYVHSLPDDARRAQLDLLRARP